MCGILGTIVFNNSSFQVTSSYLERMLDSMFHRGPDGAGIWVSKDQKIGLGHRRLSIIDLSPEAAQPMSNKDGSLWISFNGEIYNHASIKKELEALGKYEWKTDHSDTEVILHSFEEWGMNCLKKFRGMFAIALWDEKKQELWLVRDRIGIKPLYYSVHSGRLTFASEIRALLKDPGQKREVEEEQIYHYLTFLTSAPPHTLFKGIKKLQGGCWLRIKKDGSISENRYWDVLDNTYPLINSSEDEIAKLLLSKLRESVKLRMVSDVPVGVFLSGGIDSSINAALFSENTNEPIKAFTIGYEKEYSTYKNEMQYARFMAEKVGADYHEMVLSLDGFVDFLPKMIKLQDEPIGDPVCYPNYFVSKLARDNGVIVCQVGEGADELFVGYPSWKRALDLSYYNELPVPRSVKKFGRYLLKTFGKSCTAYYDWLDRGIKNQPIFWGGTDAVPANAKWNYLSPRLRSKFDSACSWNVLNPIYERFMEKAWEPSYVNWMSYVDLNIRLPELMLMRMDKMSMGVSLEGRVPFLDHEFVELAMSIPSAVKFKDNNAKYILKKAVDGCIPNELIHRKKQGFHVPVYEWFFEKLGAVAKMEVEKFCRKTDYFDFKNISKAFDKGLGTHAWYLLNFVLWWKEFIGGESNEKLQAN